jgi:hypothetical protein
VSEKGFAKSYAQGIDFTSLMSWQYVDQKSLLLWTKPPVGKNYTYPDVVGESGRQLKPSEV